MGKRQGQGKLMLDCILILLQLQDIKHDHEAVLKYYKMSINEQGIPDVQLLTKARGTQSDKRKEVTENDSSVKKRKYMQEQSDVLSIENEKLKETVRSQAEEIVRLQQESLAFREENVKLKAAVSYKQEENAKLHQELASSREEYTNLRAENSIIRCKRLMPVIEKPRLENYNPKDYNDPQKIQQNEVFIKETLDFCLELAPNLSKHVLFLDSGIGRTTLEFMKHPVTDLTFHIPNDSTSYEQLKQLTREYKNVNVIQTELSMILSSAYFTDSQYLVAAWLDGTSAFKKLLQNFEAILASYHAILPEGMVLALTWTKHGNDKSLTPDVCMNTLKDTAQKYSATFYPSTTFPDFFPKHYRRIIFVLGRLVFDQ